MIIITPVQCRMARAGLCIGQKELSEKSNVGWATITDFERERADRKFNKTTLMALRSFFEKEGVIFLNNSGIDIKKQ